MRDLRPGLGYGGERVGHGPRGEPDTGRHHAVEPTSRAVDPEATTVIRRVTIQPLFDPDDDTVEETNRAATSADPATAVRPDRAFDQGTRPVGPATPGPAAAAGSTAYVAPKVGSSLPDQPPDARPWKGDLAFVPYEVGDPGRAATVPAVPDPESWDRRDTVIDGLVFRDRAGRPVELRAASARGRAHRAGGSVRQDAYAYRATPDGRYLVAVVADGVSSGPLSHFAAEVVARSGSQAIADQLVTRQVAQLDWQEVLQTLVEGVVAVGRRRLRATVPDVDGLTTRQIAEHLASTALFAVVDLEPVETGYEVHTLSVGDTSAWVLRSGGRWEPQEVVKNAGAEIASSGTKALPLLPQVLAPPTSTVLGAGEALVLMTDGVGDPLGDGVGSVGAFLATVWARPPYALEFAAQVDFARKSHDDDRTAVAIWSPTR